MFYFSFYGTEQTEEKGRKEIEICIEEVYNSREMSIIYYTTVDNWASPSHLPHTPYIIALVIILRNQ